MAETSVLAELMFEVAPHWNGRLEKYIKESASEDSQKQNAGIILTPSGLPAPKIVEPACDGSSTRRIVSTPGVAGVAMPAPSPTNLTPPAEPSSDNANAAENTQDKQNTPANHGACRLDSKPDPKARFSSLTSPVVMYDGESQQMLCDMWTALNNRRGGLRKEMMAVKRRQQLAAAPPPRIMPEIPMDSDGEGSDKDDEDVEHNAEMLRLRLKMEREKMKRMVRRGAPGGPIAAGGPGADMGGAAAALGGLQFKRARMMGGAGGPPSQAASTGASADDEKMVKLLEVVDDNLDKACRVTETVAFLWLKGDPYALHLKFIIGRLKDIEEKIEKSGLVPPKKKEDSEPSKKKEEVKVQELVTVMAPPPHLTPRKTSSPRLEISKKKSDLTMRDAPSLKLVQVQVPQPLPSPPLEKQIRRKKSGSSSEDTVGPSMESVNPPLVLVTIPAGGSNKHGSGGDLKTNPFFTKPGVLEVDVDEDDSDTDSADEGILC